MSDNELIAEFMGRRYGKNADKNGYLKYNTSWDHLMPVVEKIENGSYKTFNFGFKIGMHDWVSVYSRQGTGEFTEFSEFIGPSKLDATHKAVVHFIKWYNQQPRALTSRLG